VTEEQWRLEAALDEQARMSERLERSIGTSGELAAYLQLRAATRGVEQCQRDHDATSTRARDGCARFVFSLLCESTAPGVARAEIERRLAGRVDDETLVTTLLLASETVTNAVMHGTGRPDETVDVEADLSAERLWVGVTNSGPACDHVPAMPATHALGGRGLFLVEELSNGWGTGHADGTTSVWFEVDRHAVAAAGGEPEATLA
jgi:anti-sigma regulatory factor (Ser/Thr protein kinase)